MGNARSAPASTVPSRTGGAGAGGITATPDDRDTARQWAHIHSLIEAAPAESSDMLVQWLLHQRGPPSSIISNFETMLERFAGVPRGGAAGTEAAHTGAMHNRPR